jgi:GT2 family glycosyltransferase
VGETEQTRSASAACTIGVLMTCHQQREQVLSAIAAVYASNGLHVGQLQIYLVDDGSTDGTREAVHRLFPRVCVIHGTGAEYWNGGMRAAFTQALQTAHDYHLWLNSDTVVRPDALAGLLRLARDAEEAGSPAIVSGATVDANTGVLTSSAFRFRAFRSLMSLQKVAPGRSTVTCDTAPGNCLLVPRTIYEAVGNLSDRFSHSLGDVDYGLRAKELGFGVLLAPGLFATSPNASPAGHMPRSLMELRKRLNHPKGLTLSGPPPAVFWPEREWRAFLRRHSRIWFVPWFATYAKLVWLLMVAMWLPLRAGEYR